MRAALALHVALSMRLDAIEAYRLAHAYRDEELRKFADRLASRASLYGDSRTVNEVIKDLRHVAGEEPAPVDAAEAYPGELATYRQLVRALRADVRPDDADLNQVRERLHRHAATDVKAREEAKGKSSREADATPDFFQPGHTYADSEFPQYDWQFRCDTITTHPEDGERTALGWRSFNGSWEPYAYGEDDWDVHKHVGHTDVTEDGER
ncbi:hypothetical protein [Streptomyces sp. NPDC004721]